MRRLGRVIFGSAHEGKARQKSRWGSPAKEFVPAVHLSLPDNFRAMTQTIPLHRIAVFSLRRRGGQHLPRSRRTPSTVSALCRHPCPLLCPDGLSLVLIAGAPLFRDARDDEQPPPCLIDGAGMFHLRSTGRGVA